MITDDELAEAIRAVPVPPPGPSFRDDLRAALEVRRPRRRRRWSTVAAAAAVAVAVVGALPVVVRDAEEPLTVAAITPVVADALAEIDSFAVTVTREQTESIGDGEPVRMRFHGRGVFFAAGDYWLENLVPSTDPGSFRWASYDSTTKVMQGEFVRSDGTTGHDVLVGQADGGTGLGIILGGDPVALADSVQHMRESGAVPVEEVELDGRSAWHYVDTTRLTGDDVDQHERIEMWVDRKTGLPLRVESSVRWSDGERESVTTFEDVVAPASMPPEYPGDVPPGVTPSGNPDAVERLTIDDAVARHPDRVLVPSAPTGYELDEVTVSTGPASVIEGRLQRTGTFHRVTTTFRRGFRSITLTQHWTVMGSTPPRMVQSDGRQSAMVHERLLDGEWVPVAPPPPPTEVVLRAGPLEGETAMMSEGNVFVDHGDVSISAIGDDTDLLLSLLESLRRP